MTLDQDTLATMTNAADEIWNLREKAAAAAENSPEAILVKTLTDKWGKMNRKIEAVKLLLADDDKEDKALA